jgi:hypothetical protein
MSEEGVMALKGALGFPNGEVVAAAGLGGEMLLWCCKVSLGLTLMSSCCVTV